MAADLKKKKKQNEYLEEVSLLNQSLKDEIEKEVKINSVVQGDYQKRILNLQSTATSLCRLIEIEKKKNSDLKMIIEHLETKQLQEKITAQESSETNTQNIETLTKKLQKLEYDFEQYVQKQNESLAQINEVRDKVNASRTERVIYSGVFKNIEKQIRQSEEELKELIIERCQAERRRRLAEEEYVRNKREENEKKYAANVCRSNNYSSRLLDDSQNTNTDNILAPLKDYKPSNGNSLDVYQSESILSASMRKPSNSHVSNSAGRVLNSKDEESQKYEHLLLRIKVDTGLQPNELVARMDGMNGTLESLFQQSEQLHNRIYTLQQKLSGSHDKKTGKNAQGRGESTVPDFAETESQFQGSIGRLNDKITSEKQELCNFMNSANLKQLCKALGIECPESEADCESSILNLFKEIEHKLSLKTDMNKLNSPKASATKPEEKGSISNRDSDAGCPLPHNNVASVTAGGNGIVKDDPRMLNQLMGYSDKSKECDKILLPTELREYCLKEMTGFKESVNNKKSLSKNHSIKKKLS